MICRKSASVSAFLAMKSSSKVIGFVAKFCYVFNDALNRDPV
jgi:hypothetical protein